jgi:urease accessory protein
MDIVHQALSDTGDARESIVVAVERGMLAKRRWRGVAADGREFGFDLERPLADGATVFREGGRTYVVKQKAEPVLVVQLGECGLSGAADFARLGWIIGNLHFPLALEGDAVLVPDDAALRQLFDREQIAFATDERVFKPLSGGHSHADAHEDHHHH